MDQISLLNFLQDFLRILQAPENHQTFVPGIAVDNPDPLSYNRNIIDFFYPYEIFGTKLQGFKKGGLKPQFFISHSQPGEGNGCVHRTNSGPPNEAYFR